MLPFFRSPDPAWQSRRTKTEETPPGSPSSGSDATPKRGAASSFLLKSSPATSSTFQDEQSPGRALYYDHLTSGSSVCSDIGDEQPTQRKRGAGDNDSEMKNPFTSVTAAQLEWVNNEHGPNRTFVSGVPTDLPSRPTTPVAGNKAPPQTCPKSPSEAPPNFPNIPPHHVEDETIINPALAEAWFAKRRAERLQQMIMYDPKQQQQPSPMMDPRTGGFSRGPPPMSQQQSWQQQQQYQSQYAPSYYPQQPNGAIMVGPVDVDSGSPVDSTPTAQAIVLRNPFEEDSSSLQPHYVHNSAAYDLDNSSVFSKPQSVNSYSAASTSEMTQVISNVKFPQNVMGGRYASSSYAASSSSVAYTHNNSNMSGGIYVSDPRDDNHPQHAYDASGERDHGDGSNNDGGVSKGLCACGGSSGGDRNSCKGFLDIRTYHGKLAILLVTILVLAIATMIASSTMTFKTNQNSKESLAASEGDLTPRPAVTKAPSMAPIATPSLTSAPTRTPVPTPTVPSTKVPASSPTRAPTSTTSSPTSKPPITLPPTTSSPTSAPTPQPTPKPTIRTPSTPKPTPRPTNAPTVRPTDSLENFVLPQVTTIVGPAAGSFFGTSVALSRSGQFLAVGSPEYANRSGEVTVMEASVSGNDQWNILANLRGGADDTFGYDVSLSRDGSILAVGAPGGNGTVYTYVVNPYTKKYVPISNPIRSKEESSAFGHSIALSLDGFRLVAGAPYASSGAALNGVVRVYELQGSIWTQMGGDLAGGTSVDWLGSAVDISADGNMVIASAPKNRSKKGYVRAWTWDGTNWIQVGKDMVNDVQPAFSSDRFGHSVALSQDSGVARVAIGIPYKTVGGQWDAGLVVVYQFVSNNWVRLGNPIQQARPEKNMEAGNSVDLDGGILSVGIPGYNKTGAVALYRLLDGDWRLRPELILGSTPGDDFGVSLSSHRDPDSDGFALVVGALMDGNDGAGYVASFVKQD